MKVAFQMLPGEELDRELSTALVLIQEANIRGYEVFRYEPDALRLSHDGVSAYAAPIKVDLTAEEYLQVGPYQDIDLTTFDVVFMRQVPPMDMGYITGTYILEHLQKEYGVFVTNDPVGIRNSPEKLSVFGFKDYIPPTLVTRDERAVERFFDQHEDVIIKPLYNFFGEGIKRTSSVEGAKEELKKYNEPLSFQKFLPEVFEGNKRIVLFDGEIVGAKLSVSTEGSFNSHEGYEDSLCDVSDREIELCKKIGAYARDRGLHFVGVDMIGDFLIEINVTCPGSLRDIYYVHEKSGTRSEINYEARIWDVIEKKRANS